MNIHSLALILGGAAACAALAVASAMAHGPAEIAALEARARTALDAAGGDVINASFRTPRGALTRHPLLSGGTDLPLDLRQRAADAVGRVKGVGGVRWADRPLSNADGSRAPQAAAPCQRDVEAILKSRSIRFADASAAIDPASETLLDEVGTALRPCVGAIIAVIGHTDARGLEAANVALSGQRAAAVRDALLRRGIPSDGLRAKGIGSEQPLPGLDPADPANRRIEFSVIAPVSLRPTPVDTPGAG